MSSYKWPPEGTGGGSSGVSSLNALTGSLSILAGSGISVVPSGSGITITNTGSGGTVTSVALTDSTGLFTITGSPITTSGTLDISLSSGALPVANGGTSHTSLTAYSLLAGGTTSTGALQQISGLGTSGQRLTSNGPGALPTWQDVTNTNYTFADSLVNSSGTITLKNDTGTPGTSQYYGTNNSGTLGYYNLPTSLGTVTSVAMTVPSFLSVSGSPITSSGTFTVSLSGTALGVANGGTGQNSLTANQVLLAGNTSTGAFQQVSTGTAGYVLTSNGSSSPSWQPVSVAGGSFAYPTTGSTYGGTNSVLTFTGTYNTVIGLSAGADLTTSSFNTFLGNLAGHSNSTGQSGNGYNVAIGASASLTATAEGAVVVGASAIAGGDSVAIGYAAGSGALSQTVAVGANTVVGETGSIAIGFAASAIGQNTTVIGVNATDGTGFSNSTALGHQATITASNQMVLGNTSVTSTLLQGAITLGATSTTPQHILNTATATGSGTSTLGASNSPGGSTPAGWIEITINGTTRYIPFF